MRKLLFDQHIKKLKETDFLKTSAPFGSFAQIRRAQRGACIINKLNVLRVEYHLLTSQLPSLLISHFSCFFLQKFQFSGHKSIVRGLKLPVELPAAGLSPFSVGYFLEGNYILIFFIYVAEKLV